MVYYLYPIHGILFIPYTWYIIYTLYMVYYLYPIHCILFIPYTWYKSYLWYILYTWYIPCTWYILILASLSYALLLCRIEEPYYTSFAYGNNGADQGEYNWLHILTNVHT